MVYMDSYKLYGWPDDRFWYTYYALSVYAKYEPKTFEEYAWLLFRSRDLLQSKVNVNVNVNIS